MKLPSKADELTHEVTLRLQKMTYGGEALGHVDGKAVFVAGGIAGEMVRAAIYDERERFARARVIEVIEASPERVAPRCPHFGFDPDACGGCHWQHMDYAAQLRYKTAIVREQLQRLGRLADPPVRDIMPSPDIWAYRNHAQFSVTSDGRVGFQAARTHRVVPVEVCYVIQLPLLEWLQANQHAAASANEQISVRCSNIHALAVGSPTSNFQSPRPPRGQSNFQIKDAVFHVAADSFFQVNTSLIATLIDVVLRDLDLHGGETVLDTYCGVGLFSRFIAPRARRVIGVEASRSAVADLRANLAAFGNVETLAGLVEKMLPAVAADIDAVVVDPPRAGCGPQVLQALIARQIARIVYVSCDPATLARDVRQLIDDGYTLSEVQPLDLFPHTYHIENVALLLHKDRAIL